METVVRKWGSSNGLVIPKELCEAAGLQAGDTLEACWDAAGQQLVFKPVEYRARRTQHLSISEIFANWRGSAETLEQDSSDRTADLGVGAEFDWGADQGAEVWE